MLENINPKLYEKCMDRPVLPEEDDDSIVDEFDAREVFGKLNYPVHSIFNKDLQNFIIVAYYIL